MTSEQKARMYELADMESTPANDAELAALLRLDRAERTEAFQRSYALFG